MAAAGEWALRSGWAALVAAPRRAAARWGKDSAGGAAWPGGYPVRAYAEASRPARWVVVAQRGCAVAVLADLGPGDLVGAGVRGPRWECRVA